MYLLSGFDHISISKIG